MKKIFTLLFFVNCSYFIANAQGNIWLHLLSNKNFVYTPVSGDNISQVINLEIGQAAWNQSDIGYGKSNTDAASMIWQTATWYADGTAPNKQVTTTFNFQASSTSAVYYYAGRARNFATDLWDYANDDVWGNKETFAPVFTITINPTPVPLPTACLAVSNSPTQVSLSWTYDAVYKNVMILAKAGSDLTADPVQGSEYKVNDAAAGGKVIYKGSLSAFIHSGLLAQTHYYYRFYTVNNNYYSVIDASTKKNVITISSASCSFKVNMGKDTTICGLGSELLNPKVLVNSQYHSLSSLMSDSLVITYDATKGVTKLKGATKVYLHSGVELHKFGGWQYSVGNWGKDDGVGQMKKIGTDLWQIKIKPQTYYGYPADSSIYGMFIVFRNQDTLKGKDDSNNDIYANFTFDPPVSSFSGVNIQWIQSKYNFIQWYKDDVVQALHATSIIANSSGSYSVLITDNNGCEGRDTVKVNISSFPVVVLGNDTIVCQGNSVVLNAGSGYKSYQWAKDNLSLSVTDPQLTVQQSGVYYVTVTNNSGCKGFDLRKITVAPLPVVNLGKDTTICEGNSITLQAVAGYKKYAWAKNNVLLPTNGYQLSANSGGIYTVTVTSNAGCSASSSVSINVSPNPQLKLRNDTAICIGSSIILDASTGFKNYTWEYNNQVQTFHETTITVSLPGLYSVTVTNNFGCYASASVNISNNALPGLYLPKDTAFCQGDSVILNAGSGFTSYLWSNNSTISTIKVKYSGTYSVTVSSTTGCKGSASTDVKVHTNPVVYLGKDTAFCQGDSAILVPGSGITYLWSYNNEVQTLHINFLAAKLSGVYSVIVADAYGCIGKDTVKVTVKPKPIANFSYELTATDFQVNFTNLTQFETALQWDFNNDGIIDNTTDGNVSYTYPDNSNYTVKLIAANSCGIDSVKKLIQFIADTIPPVAAFQASVDNMTVNLTDQSTLARHYKWSFYTPSVVDDTTKGNTSHTYTDAGQFNISLTVTNNAGSSTASQLVLVLDVNETGILSSKLITIYPNPVRDILNISFNSLNPSAHDSQLTTITIFNSLGKSVYSDNLILHSGITNKTINTDLFSKGVYLLDILNDNYHLNKLLIIVK